MWTSLPPRRIAYLVGCASVWIVGCDHAQGDDPSAGTSASVPIKATSASVPIKATSAPGVTIRQGKDGRATVEGAPLRGDPKTCAALRRCCSSPDLGLMCGLTQASEDGDCAKALSAVKAYAKESGSPGCKE